MDLGSLNSGYLVTAQGFSEDNLAHVDKLVLQKVPNFTKKVSLWGTNLCYILQSGLHSLYASLCRELLFLGKTVFCWCLAKVAHFCYASASRMPLIVINNKSLRTSCSFPSELLHRMLKRTSKNKNKMKNMHKGLVAETYQETFNRMCSVFLEWQKILPGILKKLEDLCKFVTTIEKQQLKTYMKYTVVFHNLYKRIHVKWLENVLNI